MGYVDKNLINNEQIKYKAKIHWFIFLPSILLFILGVFFISTAPEGKEGSGPNLIGMALIIIGLWKFTKALIFKVSTELAITDKRVIAKTGLIKRNTIELNHSKVESYAVNQSVFGRILGFGTITINGTGGIKNPIPNIDSPIEFRNKAVSEVDQEQAA